MCLAWQGSDFNLVQYPFQTFEIGSGSAGLSHWKTRVLRDNSFNNMCKIITCDKQTLYKHIILYDTFVNTRRQMRFWIKNVKNTSLNDTPRVKLVEHTWHKLHLSNPACRELVISSQLWSLDSYKYLVQLHFWIQDRQNTHREMTLLKSLMLSTYDTHLIMKS